LSTGVVYKTFRVVVRSNGVLATMSRIRLQMANINLVSRQFRLLITTVLPFYFTVFFCSRPQFTQASAMLREFDPENWCRSPHPPEIMGLFILCSKLLILPVTGTLLQLVLWNYKWNFSNEALHGSELRVVRHEFSFQDNHFPPPALGVHAS
jgi:hypothetical protein